jgi:hypothetical protein
VADAIRASVMDIDYANFKDTVANEQGAKRARVYGRIWEVLWAVQDKEST